MVPWPGVDMWVPISPHDNNHTHHTFLCLFLLTFYILSSNGARAHCADVGIAVSRAVARRLGQQINSNYTCFNLPSLVIKRTTVGWDGQCRDLSMSMLQNTDSY